MWDKVTDSPIWHVSSRPASSYVKSIDAYAAKAVAEDRDGGAVGAGGEGEVVGQVVRIRGDLACGVLAGDLAEGVAFEGDGRAEGVRARSRRWRPVGRCGWARRGMGGPVPGVRLVSGERPGARPLLGSPAYVVLGLPPLPRWPLVRPFGHRVGRRPAARSSDQPRARTHRAVRSQVNGSTGQGELRSQTAWDSR